MTDPATTARAPGRLSEATQLRAVFEDAAVGMLLLTPARDVLRANRAFCELVGYREAEIRELGLAQLTQADDRTVHISGLRDLIDRRRSVLQTPTRYLRQDGHIVHTSTRLVPLLDDRGRVSLLVCEVDDLAPPARSEQGDPGEDWAEDHDALTGVAGRSWFERRLQELASQGTAGELTALLVIVLDAWDTFSERHGGPAGDRRLIRTAHSIGAVIRDTDLLSRIGEDRFAVVAPALTGLRDALELAEAVKSVLAQLSDVLEPIDRVTASMGVALTLAGSDDTATDLLARACGAAEQAARSGGDRVAADSRLAPVTEPSEPRTVPKAREPSDADLCDRAAAVPADQRMLDTEMRN